MLYDDDTYRVFTSRFDKVVTVANLRLRSVHERAWTRFMEDTLDFRTGWKAEAIQRIGELPQALSGERFSDTLVTLLVDHSGSMGGAPIRRAALAVDVAREVLIQLGASVEVLGFSTRSWRGGWSRRLWRWTGRRKSPGRLCDLLYLVYIDARDRQFGAGSRSLAHMLNLPLLKENVDGEALLWAAARQDQLGYKRKALILISDGAPVDDSTLSANGSSYLMDHLRFVVAHLAATRVLAQLQFGDEFESEFGLRRRVNELPDIGHALPDLLCDVMRSLPTKDKFG